MQTTTRLRAPEPTDVDRLYLWENSPELWPYGCALAPLSRHQLWEYVHSYNANPLADGQLRLIIEHCGEPVGTADLYDIDIRNRRAFVGIMVTPPHRRTGIALEALRQLAHYCRTTLPLRQLAATVAADNLPSLALFRAAAYTHAATLPSWFLRPSAPAADAHLLLLPL